MHETSRHTHTHLAADTRIPGDVHHRGHTHSKTQTHTHSLFHSLTHPHSLSLSLSLTHTNARAHTHTHTHTHTHRSMMQHIAEPSETLCHKNASGTSPHTHSYLTTPARIHKTTVSRNAVLARIPDSHPRTSKCTVFNSVDLSLCPHARNPHTHIHTHTHTHTDIQYSAARIFHTHAPGLRHAYLERRTLGDTNAKAHAHTHSQCSARTPQTHTLTMFSTHTTYTHTHTMFSSTHTSLTHTHNVQHAHLKHTHSQCSARTPPTHNVQQHAHLTHTHAPALRSPAGPPPEESS